MSKYRVDIRVDASVYVEAKDEDEARQIALSPNADDLVQHDAFMADGVRIDSVHVANDWMHRCLHRDSDIVWLIDDEGDDTAFDGLQEGIDWP